MEALRMGANADTSELQNFSPTVLVPFEGHDEPGVGNVASTVME